LAFVVTVISIPSQVFGEAVSKAAGPEDPRADAYYHFTLGTLLANEGNLQGALDQLNQAARIDPSSAEIRVELADLHLRHGDVRQAVTTAREAVERAPETAEAHLSLANALAALAVHGGDGPDHLIEAILEYRTARDLGVDDSATLSRLARLELRAGMTEEAIQTFRRIINNGDSSPHIHLLLGRALQDQGEVEESIREFEAVVGRFPRHPEALGAVASLHEKAERWPEAARAYQALAEIRPDDPALHFRLGVNLLRAGRPAEAIAPLRFASEENPSSDAASRALAIALRRSGRPAEAIDRYRRLLVSSPGDPFLLTDVASLHRQRGELEKAAELFGQALSAAERTPEAQPDKVDIAVELASVELGLQRPEKALSALDRAEEFGGSEQAAVILLKCRALIQAGEAVLAAREAARGRVRFPDSARFRLLEAEAALALGDRRSAELDIATAIEQSREDRDTYFMAADLWARNGHQERALQLLEGVAQKWPNDDRAWFEWGGALERAGRVEEAMEMLHRSIDLNGSNHLALNYLGYLLAERGERLEEAQSMIERAVALAPNNGAYLDSLGWVLFRRGLPADALEPLGRAVDLLAGDSTVREHLGDVLAAVGRWGEAQVQWRRAQELGGPEERLTEKIEKAVRKQVR
jgi:tetratricopeptide (TPR) repeat protein